MRRAAPAMSAATPGARFMIAAPVNSALGGADVVVGPAGALAVMVTTTVSTGQYGIADVGDVGAGDVGEAMTAAAIPRRATIEYFIVDSSCCFVYC